jgi:hypothetical protein
MAVVGGLTAIHHDYRRFTKDIDIVVNGAHLDVLARVAPRYGIKFIWKDPDGWHKLQCEGVPIDVVPEGRKPRKDAPATIPGPRQLGVRAGAGYAGLAGWVETKLGSYRVQDQANVVEVIKGTTPATLRKIRRHLGKAHAVYLRRFDELLAAARQEREQERERGGSREGDGEAWPFGLEPNSRPIGFGSRTLRSPAPQRSVPACSRPPFGG